MTAAAATNAATATTPIVFVATLQQQIAEKFLAKLAGSDGFDAAKIEQLRGLLTRGKKPKADELVAVFSLPAGGDLT